MFDEVSRSTSKGHGAATSIPPYGTGKPLHLAIELTIVNIGHSPVFIVGAKSKDPSGRKSIDFNGVCNENEPLEPGGRRRATRELLHHDNYLVGPQSDQKREHFRQNNLFAFQASSVHLPRGSAFHIETGRGTTLAYPATEVCGEAF